MVLSSLYDTHFPRLLCCLPQVHKLFLQLPRTVQNGECNTIPTSFAADDPSLTQDVLQSTESTDSLLARVMLRECTRGPPR